MEGGAMAEADVGRLAEELKELKEVIRRLDATVRSKIAAPIASLSTAEAARVLGCSVVTVRRYLDRGVFTDVRAGRRSGSPWRVLADELDMLRLEGEEALAKFREAMGRV